jgi:NDP-sugar pyrophosphorylase family protein
MKAMIFAAGLGTRLQPLTNTMPKALVEVGGMPLLEFAVRRLKYFGFNDIIINIHHFGNRIVQFLKDKNNFNINISISDESDLLLDTGGGLKKASWFFNDNKPFLVYNVDIITDIDLIKLYDYHRLSNILATLAVSQRESGRAFLFNNEDVLCGWNNSKTGEEIIAINDNNLRRLPFCGIHIISPHIFDLITETGVFSIVNTYVRLAKDNIILAYEKHDVAWTDVGKPENLEQAENMISTIPIASA